MAPANPLPSSPQVRVKPTPHPPINTASIPHTIAFVSPHDLLPHESTSTPHLSLLTPYLTTLPPSTPLPVPAVTPKGVILDGHHRVAASVLLRLTRIPVWVVSDVRVYDVANGGAVATLEEVERRAVDGDVWGIKGTRCVVTVGDDEYGLEAVAPKVQWGEWLGLGPGLGQANLIDVRGSEVKVKVKEKEEDEGQDVGERRDGTVDGSPAGPAR